MDARTLGTVAEVLAGEASWHIDRDDAFEALARLPDESVQCVVTSPPYWSLRDYGVQGQIGVEITPDEYVASLVRLSREVRRVLRGDGTFWLNLGDTYATRWGSKRAEGRAGLGSNDRRRSGAVPAGLKEKDLVGVPWRTALALRSDGWWLRADIVWSKPNPVPEPVRDRTTRAHEYVFLLTKSATYFYDGFAVREPIGSSSGYRTTRSVWTIPSQPFRGAHFATFPGELARRCILAGTSSRGCCALCGAPLKRIVERVRTVDGQLRPDLGAMRSTSRVAPNAAQGIGHWRIGVQETERGWAPTCACACGDVHPCVVLDPFAGSGTTGIVALREGRRFLGIDLNPAYVELASDRIREAA